MTPFDDGLSLREFNALLTTVVFAGLLWRLIGRWPLSSWLSRCVLMLFAAIELIVALSTARAAALGAPFNEGQYAITVHSAATLLVIVAWPRLLDPTGRRT